MKKYLKIASVILCVLVLVIAMVACNEKCTEHVDNDSDKLCDVCGESMPETPAQCTHVDKNLDEKCDVCGEDQPLNDGKHTYSVFVSNGIGGGYADVIVEFHKEGQRVTMQPTDANGYVYTRLALDKYDVVLVDTLSRKLSFGEGELEVTPTKKNLVVEASVIIASNEKVGLMECDFIEVKEAPFVKGEGSFVMSSTTTTITPIVWVAEKTGIYSITFESNFGVYLTYNGGPLQLYEQNLANEEDIVADNQIKMTIRAMNLPHGESEATPYVFGVKSKVSAGNGILKIKKIAEAPISLEELPWNYYPANIPGDLNLPEELAESDLSYFNLTQAHELVYNETDGLYHLGSKDGKVVYIQLKHTPTTMPSATADEPKDYFTLEALANNGHFGVYIFDEDGNFVEKNSYQEHIFACLENAHENAGIYYLTSGMIKGIQEYGTVNKWWDFDTERHIFGDKAGVSILEEYAWMFCLCTID